VILATPVSTHRDLAESALRAGKHILVEKPLARTSEDAAHLVGLADRMSRVLATGHLFIYHPAIARIAAGASRGEFGRLCYATSDRVNLGPPASEVDVVWDLAVHDVAIMMSILGHEPEEVRADGRCYIHPTLTDVAVLTLVFADGVTSHHHVSWLSPLKVRRFFLVGTEGSATFDDMRLVDKLRLTDRGEDSRVGARDTDAAELYYRPGEVRTPDLPSIQPLTAECVHFLECIRTNRPPIADGRAGLAVVRVLEAADQSIALGGRPISLAAPRS
jgi:predicted dehydrogenase